jgi:hypothetical protein
MWLAQNSSGTKHGHGGHTLGSISGVLNVTDQQDVVALAGAVAISGTLAVTDQQDSVVMGGSVANNSPSYPNASNTGVPQGTTLQRIPADVTSGTGWNWDARGWVYITGANTVFSAFDVAGPVIVTAHNVTIQRCRIVISNTANSAGINDNGGNGTIVQDCEIAGSDAGANRLDSSIYAGPGITFQRNNVYNCRCGLGGSEGTWIDNYVHDFGYISGDHTNGFIASKSTGALLIRHNTILNQIAQTDAVALFQDFGPINDVQIDNNLLAGGGYTIYGGGNGSGSGSSNVRITNNKISTMFYPTGGYYGPEAYFDTLSPGNVWSGNTWYESGAPINVNGQTWQNILAGMTGVIYDDFPGGALDLTKWTPNWFGANAASVTAPVSVSGEDAAYDPAQVTVSGGFCNLTAVANPITIGAKTYPYRTGSISSKDFKRLSPPVAIETRVNFDALSAGVVSNWPVAWLNGVNPPPWPDCGENDYAENNAAGVITSNLHKATVLGSNHTDAPIGSQAYSGDTTGWHTFICIWQSNAIYWIMDGVLMRTWTGNTIPVTPEYMMFTHAIPAAGGPRIGLLKIPSTMQIAYVKIYT